MSIEEMSQPVSKSQYPILVDFVEKGIVPKEGIQKVREQFSSSLLEDFFGGVLFDDSAAELMEKVMEKDDECFGSYEAQRLVRRLGRVTMEEKLTSKK